MQQAYEKSLEIMVVIVKLAVGGCASALLKDVAPVQRPDNYTLEITKADYICSCQA